MFSPGGTKPGESPSSDSSATYVDPDLVKKTVGEGTEENTAVREGTEEITDPNDNTETVGEGTEETTDPNAPTLKDPTSDVSDPLEENGDNPTKDMPSDGEVVREVTIILVKEVKTDVSNEGLTPQNEGNSNEITSNPPEEPIGGNEDDGTTPHDGSPNTASEEWKTILDKRTAKKNKSPQEQGKATKETSQTVATTSQTWTFMGSKGRHFTHFFRFSKWRSTTQ
jgi:hypothetical protein